MSNDDSAARFFLRQKERLDAAQDWLMEQWFRKINRERSAWCKSGDHDRCQHVWDYATCDCRCHPEGAP